MCCHLKNYTRIAFIALLLSLATPYSFLFAQEEGEIEDNSGKDENPEFAVDNDLEEINEAADELVASSKSVRRFHEVLDELLAEFGYDVETGQIGGLKNLAIRKVDVSDAIPSTYRKYLDLLISERIRENSEIKLLTCIPCTSKTSRMIEGKIIITSPATNIAELRTAAERIGIDNFMDIVLVYHSTHMVLAMQIFKSDTNELVWSRSYNSETIRSRYQKLAIDYSQVARSRPGEDYQPEYRLLLGLGGAGIPNVAGGQLDSTMLDIAFRSTEKFDNRRAEFGMLLNAYVTLASILNEYPKVDGTGSAEADSDDSVDPNASDFEIAAQPQPFSFALGLFGIFSKNFLGVVESYNQVRHGAHVALGAVLTSGYLAPAGKLGWDAFFGKRFMFSLSGIYIAPSQITLDESIVETTGGVGGEGVLSFNF
ncbi:MAG: hypothetical protein AB8G05_03495 [Oligoflexales bacterium]